MTESGAARREELAAEIAEIVQSARLLPGTVLVRMMGCGNPRCRCHADPPRLHGPYFQWTRKIGGKTRTRRLSIDEYERYRPWFDNARRLRELTAELESLCLHEAAGVEGWDAEG